MSGHKFITELYEESFDGERFYAQTNKNCYACGGSWMGIREVTGDPEKDSAYFEVTDWNGDPTTPCHGASANLEHSHEAQELRKGTDLSCNCMFCME